MADAWVCGRCGRRVPGYIAACHCGGPREEGRPAGAGGSPGPGEGMPWEVKAGIVFLVVLAGLAAAALMRPRTPDRLPALLGVMERLPVNESSPRPRPSPSPGASGVPAGPAVARPALQ